MLHIREENRDDKSARTALCGANLAEVASTDMLMLDWWEQQKVAICPGCEAEFARFAMFVDRLLTYAGASKQSATPP